MPDILINSLTDVLIDGTPMGGVVDVLFHAAIVGDDAIRAPFYDEIERFFSKSIEIASKIPQNNIDELAKMTTEKDRLVALLADAKSAFLAGDHDKISTMISETEKSDAQKAYEAAQKVFDDAKAALDSLKPE